MSSNYFGENLIFIISQPRSGSTLLQRILSGHPEVQTSAETWLMLHPAYGLKKNGYEAEYGSRWAAKGVEDFINHYTTKNDIYYDAIREWARTIYSNALLKGNKTYFLDKTPRYFFIIQELYCLFPKAKFIFLIRNPLAILSSELSTYVKNNWPVISLFQPDLLLAPRRILEGIELLGNNAITIHYEKLVASPVEHVSSLCNRLGISFNEQILNYANTPVPKGVMNDSTGIHQHTSPTVESMDKWKLLVNNKQTRHFAQSYLHGLGREVIEKLGYSFDDINMHFISSDRLTDGNDLLFPWDIAIRPKSDWTFREQLIVERFFLIYKKGKVLGTISFAIKSFRLLRKALKNQLSLQGPPTF